jgi:hypothetical protein
VRRLLDASNKELAVGDYAISASGKKVQILEITPPRYASDRGMIAVRYIDAIIKELLPSVIGAHWSEYEEVGPEKSRN